MCSGTIESISFPIRPDCCILEILVKPPVLKILRAQDTMSSTSIHKVLVGDGSRSAIFPDPFCRDGFARV